MSKTLEMSDRVYSWQNYNWWNVMDLIDAAYRDGRYGVHFRMPKSKEVHKVYVSYNSTINTFYLYINNCVVGSSLKNFGEVYDAIKRSIT